MQARDTAMGGWTIGAGGEAALTDNVIFKAEYLYTDFGKANPIRADLSGAPASLARDYRFHAVRAGINFKFWLISKDDRTFGPGCQVARPFSCGDRFRLWLAA